MVAVTNISLKLTIIIVSFKHECTKNKGIVLRINNYCFSFSHLFFCCCCCFFSFLIKIITIECTSCNYNIPVVGKLGTDVCWHQKWFSFSVLYLSSLTSLEKILVNNIKYKFVTVNTQWHGKTIREIKKWTNLSLLGVLDLIIVATKDEMIGEKIKSLSWKIQSEGVRVTVL